LHPRHPCHCCCWLLQNQMVTHQVGEHTLFQRRILHTSVQALPTLLQQPYRGACKTRSTKDGVPSLLPPHPTCLPSSQNQGARSMVLLRCLVALNGTEPGCQVDTSVPCYWPVAKSKVTPDRWKSPKQTRQIQQRESKSNHTYWAHQHVPRTAYAPLLVLRRALMILSPL
jgi:hypothetical protein